ncbi:MAG: TRAP transporter large permease subunit [Candidatus Auribacterota bacterium]|nr:TRAP transporter large permease subunit [Candidatus Auribacterota bacterium]
MTVVFLVLSALLGVPLFCVIGSVALYAFASIEIDSAVIIIEMVRLASAPALLAIPLFTFTGYILADSNAPLRMVNFTRALFGWLPGGVPVVAFISCAFFSAFTGVSGVTIIALGGLLYPILRSEKYSETFTLGLLTCSGSMGMLIPPSLPLILYGIISETPIDRLFAAGIIPEMMLITFLSIFSIRKGLTRDRIRVKFSMRQLITTAKAAVFEIPLPIIVLGGIYSGLFTATEAAAISAAYAVIVEIFIHRDLNFFKDVPRIIEKSMILVGSILIILGVALGLTSYMVDAQIPVKVLGWMQDYIGNKWVFLIVLNIFLLIVGCLMDIFSAIIIIVPLIKPIAVSFGVDPIHLGIIFLCNLEIGYSTPPVGINLFIASTRFDRSILDLYKSALPFIGILLIGLVLITYCPWLSLGLVKLLFGT